MKETTRERLEREYDDVFVIELPDVGPISRTHRWWLYIKAHAWFWKMRTLQKLGRGPKASDLISEALRREAK